MASEHGAASYNIMPNQNHALSCGLCRSTEALLFTANVTCNTCGTVYCSNCFQNYGIASTKCHTCLGNDFQLTMPLVPPSTLPVHHILPPLLPLSDYRMTEVNAADIWEVYMDEDVEVDDTVPPPRQPQPMQPPAPPPTALETLTLCVPVSLPIEHTMHIPCTELLCEFKSNNARQLSLHKALVHRIDLSWLYTEEGEAAAKAAKELKGRRKVSRRGQQNGKQLEGQELIGKLCNAKWTDGNYYAASISDYWYNEDSDFYTCSFTSGAQLACVPREFIRLITKPAEQVRKKQKLPCGAAGGEELTMAVYCCPEAHCGFKVSSEITLLRHARKHSEFANQRREQETTPVLEAPKVFLECDFRTCSYKTQNKFNLENHKTSRHGLSNPVLLLNYGINAIVAGSPFPHSYKNSAGEMCKDDPVEVMSWTCPRGGKSCTKHGQRHVRSGMCASCRLRIVRERRQKWGEVEEAKPGAEVVIADDYGRGNLASGTPFPRSFKDREGNVHSDEDLEADWRCSGESLACSELGARWNRQKMCVRCRREIFERRLMGATVVGAVAPTDKIVHNSTE